MITITRIRLRSFFLAGLLFGLDHPTLAAPVEVILFGPPDAVSNLNGNSEFRPFDPAPPARFQQVYDASAFTLLSGTGGGWIYEVDFRVDPSIGHPFTGVLIPNLQINLSTTPRTADNLSQVFDSNIGLDDAVVFSSSPVRISSNAGGGLSAFDLPFSFQPFFYNPAAGNLLMDIRIYQGIGDVGAPQGVAILDAFNVRGDTVSSVYASGPSMPTIGQSSSLGLATAFFAIPVPEPSSIGLLAVGLGGLGFAWLRRKRKEARE